MKARKITETQAHENRKTGTEISSWFSSPANFSVSTADGVNLCSLVCHTRSIYQRLRVWVCGVRPRRPGRLHRVRELCVTVANQYPFVAITEPLSDADRSVAVRMRLPMLAQRYISCYGICYGFWLHENTRLYSISHVKGICTVSSIGRASDS